MSSVDLSKCAKLTTIGGSAFYYCSSLTFIDLSNCTELTEIGEAAFQACSSITSATFPNSLTTIYKWAFNWCSKLTSVTFPSNLTIINDSVFYDCVALTNITWDGLSTDPSTAIGTSAFNRINSNGTIKVTNASGGYTSQQLLSWLVRNAGTTNFPTGEGTNWIAA